ncbi:hypothetical protein [Nocardia flavorosea]|uniref:Anti-sigma-M factor RsmA n=1 Tax=Nocardia flavorosea TaxID=53429 RepID=A0A846YHK2_9NOCA|nr:hypothetical protein [Nocardia flavorosea]NKY56339.1 hypothetical protein [Nocardia flavorosea]
MSPVPQPPFPAELLADLHAGNIDPDLAARLWPAVRQDPDARRYLESLDSLRISLTGLAESDRVVRPMPADIAARLEAFAETLGNEAGRNDSADTAGAVETTVPLGDIPAPAPAGRFAAADAGRSGPVGAAPISLDARRRRRRIAAGIAAAAAVLICAGAALFAGFRPEGETVPTAAPTGTTGTESGAEFDTTIALRALGRHDVPGRLADPAALTACVRAAGVDRPVLGSTEMRFRDRDDAVLILVGGRNGAQITALVVGPGCGPGNPELLTPITDIG